MKNTSLQGKKKGRGVEHESHTYIHGFNVTGSHEVTLLHRHMHMLTLSLTLTQIDVTSNLGI